MKDQKFQHTNIRFVYFLLLKQALTRSSASFDHFDCTLNAREQTNLATHWLDLSHVYGTDSNTANNLRSFNGGRLKTSSIRSVNNREFMPPANPGGCVDETSGQFCFDSGDTRTNQNMMLVSIHTVWLREHNRLIQSYLKGYIIQYDIIKNELINQGSKNTSKTTSDLER